MASGKLTVEFVTPRGVALEGSYDEVALPGAPGEFGILPGHRPLVGSVRIGIATLKSGSETRRVAVGRGFAEVSNDKVTVLTSACTEREGLDPVVLKKEFAEIQGKLNASKLDKESGDNGDHLFLIERERTIATLLELYGEDPPAILRPYNEDEPFAHAAPLTGAAAEEVANNPGA
jgi:F-type H+-transporting ATPase subunit epsilon